MHHHQCEWCIASNQYSYRIVLTTWFLTSYPNTAMSDPHSCMHVWWSWSAISLVYSSLWNLIHRSEAQFVIQGQKLMMVYTMWNAPWQLVVRNQHHRNDDRADFNKKNTPLWLCNSGLTSKLKHFVPENNHTYHKHPHFPWKPFTRCHTRGK